MSKNWATRISETINFLDTTPVDGLRCDRELMMDGIRDWERRTSAEERKALSNCMSQNGSPNRPNSKKDRAYRRALILLECAFGATPRKDWAAKMAMVSGYKLEKLPDHFRQTIEGKADIWGSRSEYGRAMADELKAHPRRFLTHRRVVISGKSSGGAFDYAFYTENGKLKINPGSTVGAYYKVRAINVPAQNYADIKDALDSIPGTRSKNYDADVMLTTQFSGCAFCFSVSKNSLVAAHVNPGGAPGSGVPKAIGATELPRVLRKRGGFSNGNSGEFKVYGRTAGSGYGYPQDSVEQMTIVAVRKESGWRVYAQQAFGDGRLVVERIDKDE